ncbi:MAG: hypothetical protein HKL95_06310 [Phycisphaerae bacterium]|nr:hypothetical protein [Phycisphaerae bacterium]
MATTKSNRLAANAEPYWFDAHLDLAYLAQTGRDLLQEDGNPRSAAAVSLPALRQGHVRRTLATIFVQPRVKPGTAEDPVDGPWCYDDYQQAHAASSTQLDIYKQWQEAGLMQILPAAGDKPVPGQTAALEAILLLEGAAGVRTLDDLREFAGRHVRVLALTWVKGTPWSGGDHSGTDITPKGRELVALADALGMFHDVSHLSEKAFWTMLDIGRNAKMASHSNCRALLPEKQYPQRHLSDRQIKALAKAGGMIGINLFSKFLVPAGRATIADVVTHIDHIAQLVGRSDLIGLGSDMDGGFDATMLPEHLEHPRHLNRLAEALTQRGFGQRDIAGFAHLNWERYFGLAPLTDG